MADPLPAASSVRVLRVFIASPGDLRAERQAARQAVDEVNQTVARPSGFHVDLIGWEDTLSAMGRPQALINEDLLSCQMFIGMLWEKWGTPPDVDGNYTSGFEEEFELATSEFERRGLPSISLFFKDIDKTKLTDPGPSLSKVIAFKDRTIAEKKVLFDSFSSVDEFAKKIRVLISTRIHKIRTQEQSDVSTSEGSTPEKPDPTSSHQTELSRESAFLAVLSKKISHGEEQPTGLEIARLRNIAFSYAYSSNDQQVLGPHDANLIYRNKADLSLSPAEIDSLVSAGLNAWDNQNAPLWTWLDDRVSAYSQYLTYKTIYGPDEVRRGALSAMLVLRVKPDLTEFSAAELQESWFGSEVSDRIKNAALYFIGKAALTEFISLTDAEYEKGTYSTRQNALEACILTRAAMNPKTAAEFAVSNSFDQLSEGALAPVKVGMRSFDVNGLLAALEHRNSEIKSEAIILLGRRDLLDEDTLRSFFGESRFSVRSAAVKVFERRFGPLSLDEAKKALVVEQKGSLASSSYDSQGHAAIDHRRRADLRRRNESDLETELSKPGFDKEELQFAIWEKSPQGSLDELRAAFDDGFRTFWQEHVERAKAFLTSGADHSTLLKLINEHRDFRCKRMMRRALTLIVSVRDRRDLVRVRKCIDDELCDSALEDIEFLRRFGSWEDIARVDLANRNQPIGWSATTLLGGEPQENRRAAAEAILQLADAQYERLFREVALSPRLLVEVLKALPQRGIKDVGISTFNNFFAHDDAAVRKAAALKMLISFGRRKVKSELNGYLQSNKYRYYNVVFWLDLSRALNKPIYSAIAHTILKETA